MESLLIALILFGALPAGLVAVLFGLLRRAEQGPSGPEAWKLAAARLGLKKVRRRAWFHGPGVWYSGEVDGFIVQVQDCGGDRADATPWAAPSTRVMRILVEAPGGWPHNVQLHRRTTDKDGDGWLTGDAEFDTRIRVDGSEAHALALLDQRTRKAALALVGEYGGALDSGLLYCDVRPADANMVTLVACVRRIVDLAAHLAAAADPPTCLHRNSHEDPLARVRLRNLTTLVEHFAAHPMTQLACRAALEDPDHEIRLKAATALGADGHEALTALALGRDAPEPLAAEAASQAVKGLPATAALELFGTLVTHWRVPVLIAALGALAERHLAEATPTVLPLLHPSTHDVRIAAVVTLGVIATTEAIEVLHTAAASHPFDLELHRVVNAAVSAIQSRVAGAGPGQLSLAVSDAGQVSLSGPGVAQGQVSLASPGDTHATPDTPQGP
jgi:hypothetical protein